jgi:hypothetical protein
MLPKYRLWATARFLMADYSLVHSKVAAILVLSPGNLRFSALPTPALRYGFSWLAYCGLGLFRG